MGELILAYLQCLLYCIPLILGLLFAFLALECMRDRKRWGGWAAASIVMTVGFVCFILVAVFY